MFRKLRSLVALVGIAAFVASGPLLAAQAYIHEISGDVTAAVGTAKPIPAQKNMNLENNNTVTTGPKSYAVLKFEDGTVVLLKENTSFQIQDYSYNFKQPEKASALFNMVRGGMRMITGVLSARNRDALKVATPVATIGIRGTEFLAELVNPLNVVCIVGSLSVTNAAGVAVVAAGQGLSVPSAAAMGTVGPAASVPISMPNVPLPPAVPGPIPPGPVVAAAGAGVGVGAAVAIGAAAAAAAAAAGGNKSTTTTHH